MACTKKAETAVTAYMSCIDQAVRFLIPSSTDSSDVVADAAMGICQPKRGDLVKSYTCIGNSFNEAENLVSGVDQKIRTRTIGKVAALQAEMHQREMMKQAPKSNVGD